MISKENTDEQFRLDRPSRGYRPLIWHWHWHLFSPTSAYYGKKKEKKKEKSKSPAPTLLYLLRRAKWAMLKLKPAECSAQEHDRDKYSMCWRVVWEQQFAGLLSIIEKAAPSKCTVLFLALKKIKQTKICRQSVCPSATPEYRCRDFRKAAEINSRTPSAPRLLRKLAAGKHDRDLQAFEGSRRFWILYVMSELVILSVSLPPAICATAPLLQRWKWRVTETPESQMWGLDGG